MHGLPAERAESVVEGTDKPQKNSGCYRKRKHMHVAVYVASAASETNLNQVYLTDDYLILFNIVLKIPGLGKEIMEQITYEVDIFSPILQRACVLNNFYLRVCAACKNQALSAHLFNFQGR